MPNSFDLSSLGRPEVRLEAGEYHGRRQLQANFKGRRLIVDPNLIGEIKPRAGEYWRLRPDRSPNGHIVFCAAEQKV